MVKDTQNVFHKNINKSNQTCQEVNSEVTRQREALQRGQDVRTIFLGKPLEARVQPVLKRK